MRTSNREIKPFVDNIVFGVIDSASVLNTPYTAEMSPRQSGFFVPEIYGWGAPYRKNGGMAVYMCSTPRPPLEQGDSESHTGAQK
jgi:hypothetical protein